MKKYFAIFALLVMLISGCNTYEKVQDNHYTGDANNKEIIKDDKSPQQPDYKPVQQPKLTTKISPAADLTGIWSGTALFKDNVGNPQCSYEGNFNLNIRQNGNNIQGTYQMTITKANKLLNSGFSCVSLGQFPATVITGTLSSSRIEFTDNFATFTGSFTSDLMNLDFESCPNQECADGTAGVGTKGNAKLIRQN